MRVAGPAVLAARTSVAIGGPAFGAFTAALLPPVEHAAISVTATSPVPYRASVGTLRVRWRAFVIVKSGGTSRRRTLPGRRSVRRRAFSAIQPARFVAGSLSQYRAEVTPRGEDPAVAAPDIRVIVHMPVPLDDSVERLAAVE